jgi:hypothetical protein
MSSQTLKDVLVEFIGKPPGCIVVETLPAVGEVGDHPTKCATEPGGVRTPEEIGLLLSHLSVMRKALAAGASHMFLASAEGLSAEYLKAVRRVVGDFGIEGADDFLLFSAAGYCSWRPITNGIIATNEFNGPSSYLIGRPMMEKMIGAYEHLKKQGVVYPIDGLLGFILRAQGRWALAPTFQSK